MAEKITIQAVSDIITSKADRQYFTFEDMAQKRYVCFITQLKEHCKLGSEIEADLTPGKSPQDSPRLDMIYVNGKPVISVEKKTPGRGYGKSKEELIQQRQLEEAKQRSIQAQTALNRAVDLAVAGKVPMGGVAGSETFFRDIKTTTREFYQLLQSLTQISEAQIIYKEIKDDKTKENVSKEAGEAGQVSNQEVPDEFNEQWWTENLEAVDKKWVNVQLFKLGVKKLINNSYLETIKAMPAEKRSELESIFRDKLNN